MPHRLVVGMTESGKTTLVKEFIEAYAKQGIIATVYSVIPSEWPGDAIVTHTEEEYLKVLHARIKAGERQLNVVDEADTLLSQSQKHNHWIATRGRHYGLENIFSTQRPTMIAPSVREMCAELCAFRISMSAARLLADDFADDRIINGWDVEISVKTKEGENKEIVKYPGATQLRKGEYLYSRWDGQDRSIDLLRAF